MNDVPDGFEPLFRSSPYLELIGPIYNRKDVAGLRLGIRAEQKHCNARQADAPSQQHPEIDRIVEMPLES